jgi:hypothetical protein
MASDRAVPHNLGTAVHVPARYHRERARGLLHAEKSGVRQEVGQFAATFTR